MHHNWSLRTILIFTILLFQSCTREYWKGLVRPDHKGTSWRYQICCDYVDENNDWLIDWPEELVGIKDTFFINKDKSIMFASNWDMMKGHRVKLEIYTPQRRLYDAKTYEVKDDNRVWYPDYRLEELYEYGGHGRWYAIWYDGDQELMTKYFTIKIFKEPAYTIPAKKKYIKKSDEKITRQGIYSHANFFFCEEIIDFNQDGKISDNEYVGIKDEFRFGKDIDIVIVAEYNDSKGLTEYAEIIMPSGILYDKTKDKVLGFHNSVRHATYKISDLYEKGGNGIWTVKWYLNDNLVHKRDFTLIK